ncbi:glutamine--tRNA ligase/YqeY domain fusion protein [Paenibacillus sp. NFR01]|uniref:glutamine--tRNA ligase/YqeY domain fusion protein n=1 Tax=Paenibacillus sp. NFR01 TaxID=1566279 RepID=UPI0008CCB4C7|nr:glutamine--tRNA ligase/YqeY domain fusion protein [Paenibacillus sp. NFR01]SEU25867.1 glutaminyl-tRNA synthetase [Paenibacillus sp. NFR01]
MTRINEVMTEKDDFMEKIIKADIAEGVYGREICTRFPPEPNGYLHIGSAFAIHTNYRLAKAFGGQFNLRFDDTNPLKEDMEYVTAITEDIKWLGCDPGEHIYFGSDYSERIYDCAVALIRKGKAYVCDLTAEELSASRGTLTEPGTDSPYRNRTPEENLALFTAMRAGAYPTGTRVLRAKIDMASPNINLRDPVLYRIIHAPHYRTGDKWCIYPMYDYAHPVQDAIEGVTHSLCSQEFKDHRPLYEWVLEALEFPEAPKQREFGRVNLTGVVTSKRYLRQLVAGGYVDGWDDPRMPTLRGLRRRGFTPESIRRFVEEIGMVRNQAVIDFSLLEHCLRQDLKASAPGMMAVLDPLKVTIINYPEGGEELLELENNSENRELGKRLVPFGRELYIEREDFMEIPAPGYHRLVPGGEVRLKGAYFLRCEEAVKDEATGEITELRCTYDPRTKSGSGFNERKVKATIHWVPAKHAVPAEVHLYDKLLLGEETPGEGESWSDCINSESRKVLTGCLLEPYAAEAKPGEKFQFMRHGFFCADLVLTGEERKVFNRIVPLKDGYKGRA